MGERQFPIGHCPECGLRWLLDSVSDEDLAALYTSGFYEPKRARGGALIDTFHRMNNAVRLRELSGLPRGRLLDVGCGKGRFLAAARAGGWDVAGVELAPASAEAARAEYGIDVTVGDFVSLRLEPGFDVITMWHVLEHLPDPVAAVRHAAELLRPGGSLIIAVPNIASLQARIGEDRWFHLDLPRHRVHFTPHALSALVTRSGMQVDRIGHFYPDMEAIGLVQSIINRIGIESDLLYRFAKRDPKAAFGPSVFASLVVALAATPVAITWTLVAPMLRTGASIQLVAHRP